MLDENQKADAMGCIFKLEFLTSLIQLRETSGMSQQEFFTIIIAGGADVAISTLGALKYKMEQYR